MQGVVAESGGADVRQALREEDGEPVEGFGGVRVWGVVGGLLQEGLGGEVEGRG